MLPPFVCVCVVGGLFFNVVYLSWSHSLLWSECLCPPSPCPRPPYHTYVEILILKVMVWWGGPLGDDLVLRVEPSPLDPEALSQPCEHPDLGLSVFRAVTNTFLLFYKLLSLWYFVTEAWVDEDMSHFLFHSFFISLVTYCGDYNQDHKFITAQFK